MGNIDENQLAEAIKSCWSGIVHLQQENENRRKELTAWIRSQEGLFNLIRCLDNMKYEWNDPLEDKSSFYYPKFYEIEETIEHIVRDKSSLARFGDGEFAMMLERGRCKFQREDEKLARRLRGVISCEEEGLLIGISNQYGSLKKFSWTGVYAIRTYLTAEIRKEHRQFINLERVYHDAFITRPYVLYADNDTDAPGKRFRNLKRIWEGRDVVFVEGSLSRLGVGNDLFDNAASIQRIEAPPTNSFDRYDEILEASLRFAQKDSLFLVALGPSAEVLVYDLFHAGFQALDIGHLDLEYEWYLRGEQRNCPVPYKYNNELEGGDQVEDIYDETYLGQIVYVCGSGS
ncbi:MAG: DUF1792 domain-containing protein [Lachnospiraceae bacterium]|nr:DUF1792 domain-containing protein [Lachnospiraceae bacterium]